MRTSRNYIIGMIIILIGLSVLLQTLGFQLNLGGLIGPLIFFAIGITLHQRKKRIAGGILLLLGFIALMDNVFHIDVGGLVVAAVLVYVGYRLINGKKKQINLDSPPQAKSEDEDLIDKEIEKIENQSRQTNHDPAINQSQQKESKTKDYSQYRTSSGEYRQHKETTTPAFKSSLLGDFHLMNHRFELEDLNIWHGIGDVKIDLSKAMIHEGETVLMINGWIGDIDIYVPYDLDVSVNATVTLGDLDVLNYKQGGLNRNISIATREYDTSTRRVKIMLSLFIGDIDVRYI